MWLNVLIWINFLLEIAFLEKHMSVLISYYFHHSRKVEHFLVNFQAITYYGFSTRDFAAQPFSQSQKYRIINNVYEKGYQRFTFHLQATKYSKWSKIHLIH